MKLKKIQTLSELMEFMPKLLLLHSKLDGKWEPECTPKDFAMKLIEHFDISEVYAEQDEDKILYFVAIMKDAKPKAKFWLLYIHTDLREDSVNIINQVFSILKSQGFTSAESNTTRLTQSYKRWCEKFGAQQKYITYEIKL